MRLLTTKKERLIRMKPPRAVSSTEKIIFPIVGLLLTCFLAPSGLPLLGMLFFGNLLKESGVTRRLAETARWSADRYNHDLIGYHGRCFYPSYTVLDIELYQDIRSRCVIIRDRYLRRCIVR